MSEQATSSTRRTAAVIAAVIAGVIVLAVVVVGFVLPSITGQPTLLDLLDLTNAYKSGR